MVRYICFAGKETGKEIKCVTHFKMISSKVLVICNIFLRNMGFHIREGGVKKKYENPNMQDMKNRAQFKNMLGFISA